MRDDLLDDRSVHQMEMDEMASEHCIVCGRPIEFRGRCQWCWDEVSGEASSRRGKSCKKQSS